MLVRGGPMATDVKYDRFLDVKGVSCPVPVLRTKKEMDLLQKDQVLKIETTDPGSRSDMAAWAKRTGHVLLLVDEGPGFFTFYMKKT